MLSKCESTVLSWPLFHSLQGNETPDLSCSAKNHLCLGHGWTRVSATMTVYAAVFTTSVAMRLVLCSQVSLSLLASKCRCASGKVTCLHKMAKSWSASLLHSTFQMRASSAAGNRPQSRNPLYSMCICSRDVLTIAPEQNWPCLHSNKQIWHGTQSRVASQTQQPLDLLAIVKSVSILACG